MRKSPKKRPPGRPELTAEQAAANRQRQEQDGTRLRVIMERMGLGHGPTAKRLGVSSQYLSDVLEGRRPLGREHLRALVALGVSATEVLGGPTPGDTDDPFTREALTGLFQTLPFGAHLTYEYRGLSAVAIKLGAAFVRPDRDAAKCYRRAGELLGECVRAPLEILGIPTGHLPMNEERTAQAFVSAMAHSIELIAHRAVLPEASPRAVKSKQLA